VPYTGTQEECRQALEDSLCGPYDYNDGSCMCQCEADTSDCDPNLRYTDQLVYCGKAADFTEAQVNPYSTDPVTCDFCSTSNAPNPDGVPLTDVEKCPDRIYYYDLFCDCNCPNDFACDLETMKSPDLGGGVDIMALYCNFDYNPNWSVEGLYNYRNDDTTDFPTCDDCPAEAFENRRRNINEQRRSKSSYQTKRNELIVNPAPIEPQPDV